MTYRGASFLKDFWGPLPQLKLVPPVEWTPIIQVGPFSYRSGGSRRRQQRRGGPDGARSKSDSLGESGSSPCGGRARARRRSQKCQTTPCRVGHLCHIVVWNRARRRGMRSHIADAHPPRLRTERHHRAGTGGMRISFQSSYPPASNGTSQYENAEAARSIGPAT